MVLAALDTEHNTDSDAVLVGPEPGIALGLLENVMEEGGAVAVVVHGCQSCSCRTLFAGHSQASADCTLTAADTFPDGLELVSDRLDVAGAAYMHSG